MKKYNVPVNHNFGVVGRVKSMNVLLDNDCVALHISCDWTSDAKAIKMYSFYPLLEWLLTCKWRLIGPGVQASQEASSRVDLSEV